MVVVTFGGITADPDAYLTGWLEALGINGVEVDEEATTESEELVPRDKAAERVNNEELVVEAAEIVPENLEVGWDDEVELDDPT